MNDKPDHLDAIVDLERHIEELREQRQELRAALVSVKAYMLGSHGDVSEEFTYQVVCAALDRTDNAP